MTVCAGAAGAAGAATAGFFLGAGAASFLGAGLGFSWMICTGGSVVPSLLGASAFGASVLGASAPPAGGAAGVGAAAGGVAGAGAAAGGVAGAGAAGLVSGPAGRTPARQQLWPISPWSSVTISVSPPRLNQACLALQSQLRLRGRLAESRLRVLSSDASIRGALQKIHLHGMTNWLAVLLQIIIAVMRQ